MMLAPLTLKRVRAWVSEPLFDGFGVSKGRMVEEEEKKKKKRREDSRGKNGGVLMDT